MKANKGLAQFAEWDRIAAKQGWQPEWIESVGEAVGRYLTECVTFGKTPTFDGFFVYLGNIAPKDD